MEYARIRDFVSRCSELPTDEIRWVDEVAFQGENMDGASPGGYLNRFGYAVIGTTIGGHAIVVGDSDDRVTFADCTWFAGEEINYEDLAGDRSWHTLPLSAENVRKTLFELASSHEEFLGKLESGEIDRILAPIA